MGKDWYAGVHNRMTVHGVLSAELYELVMTDDRDVKPSEVFDGIAKID